MTRKTMNMHRGLHPRADIHRLYLPRNEGGRGLREVQQQSDSNVQDYRNTSAKHRKKTSDRSSLETSSNQRIQKQKGRNGRMGNRENNRMGSQIVSWTVQTASI